MHYGVDVGGTKIELAIYDESFQCVEAWREATPTDCYSSFLNKLAAMVAKADAISGLVGTIGIGVPGFFRPDGTLLSSNILCLNGQTLSEDIPSALDRPVYIGNDVKAFVYSESHGGAVSSYNSALGIVIGTGFAGALCLDGEVYYGRQNIAGEFGHIVLSAVLQQRYQFPARPCGCGAVGCVEQYLSGPGLLWMCSHFETSYQSILDFAEGLEKGDQAANTVFAAYLDCLGAHLAEITKLIDPEAIVLGGGVSNINALYAHLPDAINTHLFNGANAPKVFPARFGDSSGVRGAAMLGKENAESYFTKPELSQWGSANRSDL